MIRDNQAFLNVSCEAASSSMRKTGCQGSIRELVYGAQEVDVQITDE
jgi:hypothetical protein